MNHKMGFSTICKSQSSLFNAKSSSLQFVIINLGLDENFANLSA